MAFIFGGRLSNLEKIRLRGVYFVFLAFMIEYLAGYMMSGNSQDWISGHTVWIQFVVYALLGGFFVLNIQYLGMKFIATGSLLNAIVIFANGGYMPVKPDLAMIQGYSNAVKALKVGEVFGHKVLETSRDLFIFLADIIDIPEPYLFPKTVSVGDCIIGMGAFFIIFMNMAYSKKNSFPI